MNWLVQSNLIKDDTIEDVKNACEWSGNTFVPVKIIPFSDSVEFGLPPGFKVPEPFIPYGSTSMIKMIDRSKLDKRGFFFNQENLKTSKWVEELGSFMLNEDARVFPLSMLINSKDFILDPKKLYFMKPDDDLKDFTGSIVDADGIEKFYNEVSAGGFTFSPDIKVVLSAPKDIGWEYRIFMMGDKPITYSSYKLKSMLDMTRKVPEDVLIFAKSAARIWQPDDVYVMDVCETDRGFKIVEFNCFNASGFYACNVHKIVKEVSEFVKGR